MTWIDWAIILVPLCIVMFMGVYSRRYIRGVTDYLAAGRVCGRYVLTLGDLANALSIVGLISYLEIYYRSGFSTGFWGNILAPLGIVLGLTGFCSYRFRETKAMSLGQFLEMRYSRKFRIFAAALRSLAEMLANMIFPAVAARFFIQIMELPTTINIFNIIHIPTYDFLIVLFLAMAISLICMGGTLALVITDTVQGMFLYPLLVVFAIFILCKFSWMDEVIPVMQDRVQGESFLNPYDIDKLRDFNVFSMVIVAAFNTVMHRASWYGAGSTCAAKSPHEQKMASLLGGWRQSMVAVFYILVACCLITFLNHKNFAEKANFVRRTLATRVTDELIQDKTTKAAVDKAIASIAPQVHEIGVDEPMSNEKNLDSEFLEHIHQSLLEDAKSRTPDDEKLQIEAAGRANSIFQQCRTLFNQLSISVTMRYMLPSGLFGAFCLLLLLAMLSTDDSQIYSATLTVAQDVVLPFKKGGYTPEGHIRMIRIVAISIGVFFAIGSHYMSQLDYIQMYVTLACTMWLAGCGPVMVFGLYSRFGTTAGAWTCQLTGMGLSFIYIFIQRNWADIVYPAIAKAHMVDTVDKILVTLSKPFGNYIVWKMNEVKCPVNSYEFNFFAMVFTLILYVVVSKLTCKKPFNLDRMLHRGAYGLNEQRNLKLSWTPRNVFKNIIGITPEYSKGDRFIAYGIFCHSFVFSFVICFLGSVLWNTFSRWPVKYWSWYFMVVYLIVPGTIALITTFWFGICGTIDLFKMFKALEKRISNPLDDGRVEGEMSIFDKEDLEKVDEELAEEKKEKKGE